MRKFTFVELFAGIGGVSFGFEKVGGECLMAAEYDPERAGKRQFTQEAYKILHPSVPVVGDVFELKSEEVPDHDVLSFTFPCQAFSVAGKRGGFDDARGTLYFEAMRIAREKQPKVIFAENVKGLVNHDKGKTLDTIIQVANDCGFVVDYTILNSKYFGVPQNRERWFMVGIRQDLIEIEPWGDINGTTIIPKSKKRIGEWAKTFNFDWPEQGKVTTRLRDILETEVDEKYYLDEDKTAKLVAQLETTTGENIEENDAGNVLQRSMSGVHKKEIYGTLRAGASRTDFGVIEPKMLGHIDIKGHDAIKRVYSANHVGPTLTTMGGGHRESKIAEPQEIANGDNISYCIDANYSKGIAPSGIGKGRRTHVEEIRPVLTPDRMEKRQNGRRFKENDEESFTLTSQDRHGVAIGQASSAGLPKYRIRKLTPKECFRLQNFSDDAFDKLKEAGISDSQLYKMAGNAVTVSVVKAISERLLKYL